MHMLVRMSVWLAAVGVLAFGVRAQQPNDARLKSLGQHLGRECVTCHRLDGVDNGIPAIIGWPVADFVETMGYYKGGLRPNAAMISVAQSLDDEQVKALATWFGALPPPPKVPAAKKK